MTVTPPWRGVKDKQTQSGYSIILPHFHARPVPQISPNTVLGDPGLPESGKGEGSYTDGEEVERLPPVVSVSVLLEQKREQKEGDAGPSPSSLAQWRGSTRLCGLRAFATLCLCPATEEPISRAGLSLAAGAQQTECGLLLNCV